jgi:hypothetical protein
LAVSCNRIVAVEAEGWDGGLSPDGVARMEIVLLWKWTIEIGSIKHNTMLVGRIKVFSTMVLRLFVFHGAQ